jgi:hypothetical protein
MAAANANGFGAAARPLPKVAAQSELGSRWRCRRSAHPVGWLCRFSLTIRNGRSRHRLASRLERADYLAALGHAVSGVGTFVFGVAALAVTLIRRAGATHRLHAIRHVHVGHCHVGVSGYARCHWRGILMHSRNRRHTRRKRQGDRDQDCKNGANDVQELRCLQATIMKPSTIRSRHD